MGDNISESSSNGRELPIQMQQELPEMGDKSSGGNLKCKELAIEIPKDLKPLLSTPLQWPNTCCIYKVPRKLREINPEAYTPQVVSIGPIHHGDKNLKGMHKLKLRYLADFCERTCIDWSELLEEIQRQEEQIRHSYLDTFDKLETDEFTKIVLLDSVFVIELLRKTWQVKKYKDVSYDYVFNIPWLYSGINRDLMLLENQLPYFILEHLYNLSYGSFFQEPFYNLVKSYFEDCTVPPSNSTTSGLGNKCDSFSCFCCFWVGRCFSVKDCAPQENGNVSQNDMPKQFTDVIRNLLCKNPPKLEKVDDIHNSYNVKALHEAGVKFQVDPKAWPLGVKFENGVLKMPSMPFEDETECLFRNIMAYEQYRYPYCAHFCNYILLLDDLIDTEDDVQLLVQSGVVTNWLGHNKAVKDLVNSLGYQIIKTGNGYSKLRLNLKEHCENCWYYKVALLRSIYFSNIWKGTGTIVALILLVCTLIQALNSMIEILS